MEAEVSDGDHSKASSSIDSTNRWVTFEDLVDEALEEGKLSPSGFGDSNRRKSCSAVNFSSSVSSDSSLSSLADGNHEVPIFSQSLGGSRTSHQFKALCRKEYDGSFDSGFQIPSLQVRTVSETSSPSSRKPSGDDKYGAFRKLGMSKYKGWSRRVLGSSGSGWSDEVLGCGSEDEEVFVPERPASLDVRVEEEPWYVQGHSFKSTTWDRSPSRTFLRNFP